MAIYRNAYNQRKVRPSVIRRTVVGSLVVMLSPFLTVLEHEADASFQAQNPIIHDSAPAVERHLLDSTPSSEYNFSLLAEIESSLRMEAQSYWAYENVNPEG